MRDQGRRYVSYLLRLWQTEREGALVWCASLESPTTGERQGFVGLADLYAFLEQETVPPDKDMDSTPEPSQEIGRPTMIILRHIFTVKEERMEEAIEHFRWWLKRFSPHRSRFCTPIEGAASNVLVYDEEFENMTEFKSFMSKLRSDPDFEPAREKNRELAQSRHEIWQVVASRESRIGFALGRGPEERDCPSRLEPDDVENQ